MCKALKRPNFSSLFQYIMIMLLTLSSGFSLLCFLLLDPSLPTYNIRLLQIGVESFHLNKSFFLLMKFIGKIQYAQLKGPSIPEGSTGGTFLAKRKSWQYMLHNLLTHNICTLFLERMEKLKLTWKKTWMLSVLFRTWGRGTLVLSCGRNEYYNNKHLKSKQKKMFSPAKTFHPFLQTKEKLWKIILAKPFFHLFLSHKHRREKII